MGMGIASVAVPVTVMGAETPFPPAAAGVGLRWPVLAVRLCDIALSLALLAMLLPVLILITLALIVQGDGPILFSHRRIGRNLKTFDCLKFRTMAPDADQRLAAILASDPVQRLEWEACHKLKKDPRVTPIGRFLRKTSLDELPQLINVLRGDMSLVGPRPIVFGEVPRYGRYCVLYASVRPGITGLWQISGRNDVSYRRRVALDVYYIRHQTLRLYFLVLLRTPGNVLASRGTY